MVDHSPRPPSLLAQPSYLASQVSKYGRQRLEVALEARDLRLAHQAVLSALDDFGALSQQQLADALDLDKSHLVGRIDELQRRGIVTRTQDPADRRRNRVELTAEGKALAAELKPVAVQSQQGFLDTLSTAEQETLTTLLRRVLAANDAARRGDD
jgi:MarR family transcriptional regulator, lower aerobic nicotinate degradation pathway regulator